VADPGSLLGSLGATERSDIEASSPDAVELRAGPLCLELVGADLRAIRLGGTELVQRVYFTVRDTGWATAPLTLTSSEVDAGNRRFRVVLEGEVAFGEIRLRWGIVAVGTPSGSLSSELSATALSDFQYNRIGICVHHDAAIAAGSRYLATGPSGAVAGELSEEITPQHWDGPRYVPAIPPFRELTLEHAGGVSSALEVEGGLYELEDQRNWADFSFKSYPCPTGPAPALARPGERFRQRIEIRAAGPSRAPRRRRPIRVEVGTATAGRVPPLGIAIEGGTAGPGAEEIGGAHLRVDSPISRDARKSCRTARQAAEALGMPLELALLVPEEGPLDLTPIAEELLETPIARVLVLPSTGRTTGAGMIDRVRAAFAGRSPSPPIFAGTASHFSELNRQRDTVAGSDGLVWGACPQVHATDERSILENAPAIGAAVRTARGFAGGLPCAVSTIRFSPEGEVDARASSPMAAAWTAATLADLCRSPVDFLTYVLADPGGPLAPAGRVLRDVAGWGGAEVLATTVSEPRAISALAVRAASGDAMLVTNHLGRTLDSTLQRPDQDRLSLELAPFEVLRLDLER
jgi:hypothetical protein